jgi:hypothetical protein
MYSNWILAPVVIVMVLIGLVAIGGFLGVATDHDSNVARTCRMDCK